MTTRLKSALLLTVTLLIGIVIGVLISGAVVKHRLDRVAELRRPRGILHHFEHMIEPESEAQREQIRAVLEDVAPRFEEIMRDSHRELRAVRDSVRDELDAILTDEQRARLDAHLRSAPRRPPPHRPTAPRPPRRAPREPSSMPPTDSLRAR